ncbi:ParB/RepB/Spo0J family partition protein [Armatimonas sp.]|uniref:ParB/RepB/Spo0J family partition protein n=1 Tax=Armatimonas sp. TaxID=1872638 RepID=UPI003752E86E
MSFQFLPLEKIRAAEDQPRKTFFQESLEELAASIKERGVLEPIVVRPHKKYPGFYEIIMGERRYRASKLAGMPTIPAVIREMNDEDAAADALLENFQREDLNAIEKARAIQGLLKFMSYEKTARTLGVSDTTIRRLLDLLELPEAIQAELVTRPGTIPVFGEGHARALLTLNSDPKTQMRLVEKVKAERMGVGALDQIIRAIQQYPTKKEIFLRVTGSVADQMIRSFRSSEEKAKPYKSQTAKDHLKGIDRKINDLTDTLDGRVVDFISVEEMNHLLASLTQMTKHIESFTGKVRQALEKKDYGFREVYIHCPLCGRIELIGAVRCSICWTVLRRCTDCGSYDVANGRCSVFSKEVNTEEAEAPRETSLSYRCVEYRPKFAPKGLPVVGETRGGGAGLRKF